MLDCFCGLGGASTGFHKEGFDCTGIEVNYDVARFYPYKVIVADMLTLKGEAFRGYDVIWGSPPCRDFSELARIGKGSLRKSGQIMKWKVAPNPFFGGIALVQCFLNFVKDAEPKMWIMENVAGLAKYLPNLKPQAINSKIYGGKRHVFYGKFPAFLIPTQERKISHMDMRGRYRQWERAKIPPGCSRAFARACREALEQKVEAV